MPRKRSRRKRRVKHRRRRKRRTNQNSLVFRGRGFIPQRFLTKQVYSQLQQVDAVASNVLIQFSIINIRQIDPALGGEQPMGFDQMMELYTQYQVHGCKINIRFVNATADAVMCCLFPHPSITTGWTLEQSLEQPLQKNIILSGKGGGKDVQTLSMYVSPKKLYGRKLLDNDFVGTVGTNPVQNMRWNLFVANMESSADIQLNYVIRIVYYVKFFNMEEIVPS